MQCPSHIYLNIYIYDTCSFFMLTVFFPSCLARHAQNTKTKCPGTIKGTVFNWCLPTKWPNGLAQTLGSNNRPPRILFLNWRSKKKGQTWPFMWHGPKSMSFCLANVACAKPILGQVGAVFSLNAWMVGGFNQHNKERHRTHNTKEP